MANFTINDLTQWKNLYLSEVLIEFDDGHIFDFHNFLAESTWEFTTITDKDDRGRDRVQAFEFQTQLQIPENNFEDFQQLYKSAAEADIIELEIGLGDLATTEALYFQFDSAESTNVIDVSVIVKITRAYDGAIMQLNINALISKDAITNNFNQTIIQGWST